jgi:Zn-dependent alcohol dehydrogenase
VRAALLLELGEPLEIEDVELLAPGPRDARVRPGDRVILCGTLMLREVGLVPVSSDLPDEHLCTLGCAAMRLPEAIQQAFAMTRHAGTLVPTGWSTPSATVTSNAVEFAIGARRILGCQYGGATIQRDAPRFAGLMQAGLVDPAPIVDRRFSLEEINDAFAAAEARAVLTGVVVAG